MAWCYISIATRGLCRDRGETASCIVGVAKSADVFLPHLLTGGAYQLTAPYDVWVMHAYKRKDDILSAYSHKTEPLRGLSNPRQHAVYVLATCSERFNFDDDWLSATVGLVDQVEGWCSPWTIYCAAVVSWKFLGRSVLCTFYFEGQHQNKL